MIFSLSFLYVFSKFSRFNFSFDKLILPSSIDFSFHHPAMLPAVAQVTEWAAAYGLDVEQARGIAHNILMDPVD